MSSLPDTEMKKFDNKPLLGKKSGEKVWHVVCLNDFTLNQNKISIPV